MPQTNVKHWRRLDNAAKLFPAASSKRDTRVFRFYCELKEDIQQEILQKAVEQDTGKISDLSVRAAKGTVLALSGTE